MLAGFLAGFLGFFALAALRGAVGVILTGLPAGLAAAAAGSGPGLKCARQPGESRALFWIMQAVMRSTSGI